MVNLGNKTVFYYTCRDKCIFKKKNFFWQHLGAILTLVVFTWHHGCQNTSSCFCLPEGGEAESWELLPPTPRGRAWPGGPFVNPLGSGSRAHTNQGSSQNLLFIRSWSLHGLDMDHLHGLDIDHPWVGYEGVFFFGGGVEKLEKALFLLRISPP